MTADQLKRLRKDVAKITQSQLAAELGMKQNSVSDLEKGKRPIDPCTAIAAATVCLGWHTRPTMKAWL